MADLARTAVVSKENLNGLLNDEIKNSPNGDSNDLTECSVPNHTNSRSNRNSLSNAIDSKRNYQEIDSFSDLSFKTNDEVSLQDIIESEFAARISNMNGDEFIPKSVDITHDSFDDLFQNYNDKDTQAFKPTSSEEDLKHMSGDEDLIESEFEGINVTVADACKDASDSEDVISPNKNVENVSDCLEVSQRGYVNVFKLDLPEDIPVTNFDPFTAIEEDSDCSNPLTNTNILNSPDEFPFPESPQEAKDLEKADDFSNGDVVDKSEIQNDEIFTNKSEEHVMREFFTKTISDENLENFPGQNYEENGEISKFHIVNNMSSVESVNNSFPNVSNLTSPDKNDVEEFFSSEDLVNEKSEQLVRPGEIVLKSEDWSTVEEALQFNPNNLECESDTSVLHVTNECDDASNIVEISTNANFGLTNGLSASDSETETRTESNSSEKKTTKKRKSKKGKKSDEKENISVEPEERKEETAAPPSSSLVEDLEDLSKVSVKNLMLAYSSEAPKSLQSVWPSKESEPVPLQNLKARSMVDLTCSSKKVDALRFNLFENAKNVETSRSTSNLTKVGRHPVVTGVSVRALKSSFSKFDQLSKKTVLHVRSVDATKVQKQFNEASSGSTEITSNCKSCGKQVFQMEQIKAEKSVWHKNCFRCKECNKQLSVDTYSSHEGVVYCKPHFRELFKPKAVLEDETEPVRLKKPELIIRENQPVELPPEVVRASDKPDLGLEELASLNVKSRFQVFEKGEENETVALEKSPSNVNVKRSPSILSKLAKFQKKGIDVGVRDEELNGLPIEQSSTSSEEEEEEEEETQEESSKKVIKSKKVRERPMSFSKMGDVKSVWESGVPKTREEMREERNKEIHQIRSKLFMGKQVKMKEAYEQAVRESESASPRKAIDIRCEKAKSIKECFEKGEPLNINDDDEEEQDKNKKIVEDDMSLFEAGISKKSRSLFLELDKSAKNQQNTATAKKLSPVLANNSRSREVSRQSSDNVVKSSDAVEDVKIETADISSKFKFFETYKAPEREKKQFRITPPREGQVKTESPEKEIYRDPNVVRASDKVEQEVIRTNTTAKMLSLFRQMEEKTEEVPEGPKPLKRFTPPPDYKEDTEEETEESEEEEEEEEETNPNIIRASDKVEDEYLKQAANAARAKQLRAKFEKWEEKEKEKEREELMERKMNGSTNNTITENSENIEVTSIECTKSLRARFESMKSEAEQPKEKITRPKVNRFVEIQNNLAELCNVCNQRVYPLERVETSRKIFHKTCFRCVQCKCLLRMETFTLNCGNLYCLPHFKQKFISKGNYDEGFGVDQHKAKWPTLSSY